MGWRKRQDKLVLRTTPAGQEGTRRRQMGRDSSLTLLFRTLSKRRISLAVKITTPQNLVSLPSLESAELRCSHQNLWGSTLGRLFNLLDWQGKLLIRWPAAR